MITESVVHAFNLWLLEKIMYGLGAGMMVDAVMLVWTLDAWLWMPAWCLGFACCDLATRLRWQRQCAYGSIDKAVAEACR